MTVYITMFIISEIFAAVSMYFNIRTNANSILVDKKLIDIKMFWARLFLWLAAVPFFVVAAARYRVGTDYSVYLDLQIPQILRGVDYKLKYEYLYQILIKFGVSLGNTQWVFILTHLILLFFVWLSLKKLSIDYRFSIFIFMFGAFYNVSLNTMRQFIGIAIFMYAIKFILQRDLLKYVALIIVAFMFHKTSILFLPLYWLPLLKIDEVMGVIVIILSTALSEVIRKIMIKLTSMVGIYTNYFNSQFDSNHKQWDFIIVNVAILVLIIFIKKFLIEKNSDKKVEKIFKNAQEEKIFNHLMSSLQILTATICALSSIIPNSTRIIFMFAVGQIFYLPYLVSKIKNSNVRLIVILLIVVIYMIAFGRLILIKNIGETLPYNFI